MTLIFAIDDFLFELFPVDKRDKKELEKALKKFYTEGPFEPKIEITDEFVKITFNDKLISEDRVPFQKVLNYCKNKEFDKAKPLLYDLIEKTPNISEYYRVLGQILSEEGDQKEAINQLIDALRWNPENEWALLMMGNIFAKYEDDIDTAMTYYNQVLIVKPNDNIALNNIGANLLRLGKTKEAKRYLEKAIKINSNYPNSFYALALVAESQRNFQEAFQSSLDSIKRNKNKDELYYNSFRLAVESAQKLFNKIDGEMMVNSFIAKLELECGIDIRIETSDIITTAAKIEYAENYKRNYHLVKYNPKYPAKEHLIMHELMHLELVLEARKAGVNQLFITNPSFKSIISCIL